MGLKIVEGGWDSITSRPLKDHEITEPGLYHMVKHVYKSWQIISRVSSVAWGSGEKGCWY